MGQGMGKTFYQCQHLKKLDTETSEWVTEALGSFAFENEYFIQCNYNHFSHYSVVRGLYEFLDDAPSFGQMEYFSKEFLHVAQIHHTNSSFSYDYWVPICDRPYL